MSSLYPLAMGQRDLAGADAERLHHARRFAWTLLALGLLTRLVWGLWVHPPGHFVFSDMGGYVSRAQRLANGFVEPGQRELAWQAYGTHYLIALPLRLFGRGPGLVVAGALWGVLGGVSVPMTYLLARQVLVGTGLMPGGDDWAEWSSRAVGVLMLVWMPLLMGTGWFLSEVPYCAFQLAAVWGTVELLARDEPARWTRPRWAGPAALAVGIAWALAFAIRPQAALGIVLTVGTVAIARRHHAVPARLVALAAIPIVLVVGFSSWRFHRHTGRWLGVAENASMNLTAGRCHNIVTLGEPSAGTAQRMVERYGEERSRRVSLPSFRVLDSLPPWHPFALDPAVGDTIRVDGYIGEPSLHREAQRRCRKATGVLGQVRYSLVNTSLLWFFSRQWPISADRDSPRAFFLLVEIYRYVFAIAIWVPSWIGVVRVVRRLRTRPGPALLAWQLLGSVVVAAVFFGTIRLRTPYDPYAFILAVIGWGWIVERVVGRRGRGEGC